MEIWCVKGMYRLKLVSSRNNSVFKGLSTRVLLYFSIAMLDNLFFSFSNEHEAVVQVSAIN